MCSSSAWLGMVWWQEIASATRRKRVQGQAGESPPGHSSRWSDRSDGTQCQRSSDPPQRSLTRSTSAGFARRLRTRIEESRGNVYLGIMTPGQLRLNIVHDDPADNHYLEWRHGGAEGYLAGK